MNYLSLSHTFSFISFEKSSEYRNNIYKRDNKIRNINEDYDNIYLEFKRKEKEKGKRNEKEYNNNNIISNIIFKNVTKNKEKPSFLYIKSIEDKILLLLFDNTSFI